MALITTSERTSSSTTNSLTLARISQHAAMLAIALLTPSLASSMTSDRLLPPSKNPNLNLTRHSSPIDVTTPSIAIIVNETNPDTGRNVVSSITEKVVGPQNIPGKNGKNQRDGSRNDSRNASLRILTEMRGSISLNMKELIMATMKTEKKKMEWMR